VIEAAVLPLMRAAVFRLTNLSSIVHVECTACEIIARNAISPF
jgi:hypothetical protein